MGKKILVFCGGYLMGGQETVTLNYVKELLKLGIQIHCITNAWSDGEFEKRLQILKINYTSVKLGFIYPKQPLWTLDTFFRFPKALKTIKKVISSFQPDAYYHTSFRTIYMLQHFLRTKHILHVHENITPTYFNKYLLKSIAKNTLKFIAVSNTTKNYLIDCGIIKSKIDVLYNGTEIVPLSNQIEKKKISTLGIVGQIASYKGHNLLIDAMAILKQKKFLFTLKIFGQGSKDYTNSLKEKINTYELNDFVEWMGYKENLNEIYSAIDILIVPTLPIEPFGMGIIEAGARNILTIAANVGGPTEIIEDNYNGWLFEKGNSLDLVQKLENISNKNLSFKELIQNNYDKIYAKFNIHKQAFELKFIIFED